MNKALWVTVDYPDDLLEAGRHYTQSDLDAMMHYVARLGATCVQWIFDPMWALYDADAPGGFDLLAGACEAAHRNRMRFIAVFKPFEGASFGWNLMLPQGLALPADTPLIEEPFGLLHGFRPEVAACPEMNLARRADESVDPGGRIAGIRLIQHNDDPSSIAPEDLSIWTSARNGGYQRYEGPISFSTTTAWRLGIPRYRDRPVQVVTLDGLLLPEANRFVLIRREQGEGDFCNAVEHLVELFNERGERIPSTPSVGGPIDGKQLLAQFRRYVELGLTRFARRPEARALLADEARLLSLCEGMRRFNGGWEDFALRAGSAFAVMRGKVRHRTGAMHPVYPEVRQAWLDHVRFCIARGVDGVNIRASNHNQVFEPRAFGFNPPVVDQQAHPGNFAETGRINGDAYTQFLKEAAALLHDAGLQLGVHVHGLMLHFSDIHPNTQMVPLNLEWQWELWLDKIADFVEYRGASYHRPENQRYVADRIGFAAREAGKPMIYQSMQGAVVHFEGPHHALAQEMNWVRAHPDVAAYDLYEIWKFSRIGSHGRFEGSSDMDLLLKSCWWKPAP